jgi:hypothetical protein
MGAGRDTPRRSARPDAHQLIKARDNPGRFDRVPRATLPPFSSTLEGSGDTVLLAGSVNVSSHAYGTDAATAPTSCVLHRSDLGAVHRRKHRGPNVEDAVVASVPAGPSGDVQHADSPHTRRRRCPDAHSRCTERCTPRLNTSAQTGSAARNRFRLGCWPQCPVAPHAAATHDGGEAGGASIAR